jgi:lipid A 3-O-deacylase
MVLALASLCCAPAIADSPSDIDVVPPPDRPALWAISEIRAGALEHDTTGLWSGFTLERAAADANLEILFTPWARTFGGYLRPALGATVNFNGDTSKVYADLRWEIEGPHGVFFALGLGAALHDGHLSADSPTNKALGSYVLFHPSAELGWRFDGSNSISIFADHISNGFSRKYNEGMDTVGVRLGHRFGAPEAVPDPIEMPAADFSGPYIGALAGYRYDSVDWNAGKFTQSTTSGFYYGGYAGYLFQSGRGIFGIEVDAAPIKSGMSTACTAAVTCRIDVTGLYSVRSRFGWVLGNGMIYGTAGMAVAPWDGSATSLGVNLGSTSGINYGVAVGTGFEYKLGSHLGVRAEIMHYGLPGRDLAITGVGAATDKFESLVGRAGITWYFQ